MVDKIQVTEAQNAQLVSSMNDIKTALNDVIAALDALSHTCEPLKGEGAAGLKEAMTAQKSSLQTELDNWDTVIFQVQSIYDEIQKVDKELSK